VDRDPVVETLNTAVGTLVVQCDGTTATLLSADLLLGFLIVEAGPGPEVVIGVDVLGIGAGLTVSCRSGVPQVV
jgi:hypothetical protein